MSGTTGAGELARKRARLALTDSSLLTVKRFVTRNRLRYRELWRAGETDHTACNRSSYLGFRDRSVG